MTTLGINLSHAPGHGDGDPLSEAVLAIAVSAAELVARPVERDGLLVALATIQAVDLTPAITDFITRVLDLIAVVDQEISKENP